MINNSMPISLIFCSSLIELMRSKDFSSSFNEFLFTCDFVIFSNGVSKFFNLTY